MLNNLIHFRVLFRFLLKRTATIRVLFHLLGFTYIIILLNIFIELIFILPITISWLFLFLESSESIVILVINNLKIVFIKIVLVCLNLFHFLLFFVLFGLLFFLLPLLLTLMLPEIVIRQIWPEPIIA